jgi:hypothetical protein
MDGELLSARDAARRLGISVTTLYGWLGLSDYGLLIIRGRRVTVSYLQGGPQGCGKIAIETEEVERLKQAMRVKGQGFAPPRRSVSPKQFPGIHVPLGRPQK